MTPKTQDLTIRVGKSGIQGTDSADSEAALTEIKAVKSERKCYLNITENEDFQEVGFIAEVFIAGYVHCSKIKARNLHLRHFLDLYWLLRQHLRPSSTAFWFHWIGHVRSRWQDIIPTMKHFCKMLDPLKIYASSGMRLPA